MDELAGKIAVVTGAASGIGLALARRFLTEGMNVMLADVETEALEKATAGLSGEFDTERVASLATDVRSAESVEALADATFDRFGTAHVVCNNAGVAIGGMSWDIPDDRWRWIVDVNLLGVANGIRAFVPRMIEQDEGHVVNTASAAGLVTGPLMSPYYATKHAVVALTESLHLDLELNESNVQASVLCPEWVRTGIAQAERNRPEEVSPSGLAKNGEASLVNPLIESGKDPAEIADAVATALHEQRFWVLTHEGTLPSARRRWNAIENDGQPVGWKFR